MGDRMGGTAGLLVKVNDLNGNEPEWTFGSRPADQFGIG